MDILKILSSRVALVFPGQGSQYVGMGKQLYDVSPVARRFFEQADATLGFPLSHMCFHGPKEDLDDTIHAQPAILTVSVAGLEALKERMLALGHEFRPRIAAGHSLGEYTAMVVSGVLPFEEAVRLVYERGRLMKETSADRPGGMAAVIGLDDQVLQEIVHEAQSVGMVTLANSNSPGQTVISGEIPGLQRAMELAQERGARMVQRLAISIAAHSPLMQQASQHFDELLARVSLSPPEFPLVSNISAKAMTTVEDLRQELAQHLTLPVQWTFSIREMIAQGVDAFVEIGPQQVLSGLIKRISKEVRPFSLTDVEIAKIIQSTE